MAPLDLTGEGAPLDLSDQGTPAPEQTSAPPHVHAAVQWQESRGNMNAVSPKGAKSDMGVMDATNRDPGFGVVPAQDNSLAERSRVGHDYLNALYDHYGNQTLALAAYNGGPKRVDRWLAQNGDPRTGEIDEDAWTQMIPLPETRDYVGLVGKPDLPPP